jgi:hypothetical protein
MAIEKPAGGYNFNNFQEIKSHSSLLYNERMAVLFWMLDNKAIEMNTSYEISKIKETRAILKQIYKNIRMLIRYNPMVRASLNLDTKDEGTYVTDVVMGMVDKMIEYCEKEQYTQKRVYIIISELNKLEVMIKDVLQYFHYFIRPDFRQKPDVEIATEKYKSIADAHTIEELQKLVGKNNLINFEELGRQRIKNPMTKSDEEEEEYLDNFYGPIGDAKLLVAGDESGKEYIDYKNM